jgi:hypothetical protein
VIKYKSVLKPNSLVLKATTNILRDNSRLDSIENLMKFPTYGIRNFDKRPEKQLVYHSLN